VLNYQENYNNNNNNNKLDHAVAQGALIFVASVASAGDFFCTKNLNHCMRFYVVAFPSNASKFCPQQAVSPFCVHCNAVSLCHTPTLKFQGLPPNGRKRQDIEFSSTEARMVCNRHD
jgi:hypothetical protein